MKLLEATLGDSRLLTQAGGRRLHLLNASAAVLWDCWQSRAAAGGDEHLIQHLIDSDGLSRDQARGHVTRLLDTWRQAGLLSPTRDDDPGSTAEWILPPPPERPAETPTRILTLAGLRMGLDIEDDLLARRTLMLCEPMATPGGYRCGHRLRLSGDTNAWRLALNDEFTAKGRSADAAALAVFKLAVDLACQSEDRLLVVHGAGLAMADGRALLLIGPGGSGKTTLAAGLNAGGRALLSDDVVPVRRDGALLGLNTPLCLKAGSWPDLESRRPTLAGIDTFQRFERPVRYLPPLGRPITAPLQPGLMLFPRYRPLDPPTLAALTPEAALQGIVEAEAVIRGLDQAKLDDLARWVTSIPAWSLTYPDLETGLNQVDLILR